MNAHPQPTYFVSQQPQPRKPTTVPLPLDAANAADAAEVAADLGLRREARAPLDLAIFTFPLDEVETKPTRSVSRNVSPAGMFIATRRPEAEGRLLFLEAFPPDRDDPPLRSRAVVRWRRRWLEPRGMGVELLDVGPEDRQRLLRWMGEGRQNGESGGSGETAESGPSRVLEAASTAGGGA